MRHQRHAKIVATIGPASSTPERLRELFLAGADVFRLNFSHGTHDDHRQVHTAIRALERETGRPIAIRRGRRRGQPRHHDRRQRHPGLHLERRHRGARCPPAA
jgi:hypothetical protein